MPQDRSGKAGLPTPDSGPGAEGRERFSGRCKTARAPGRVVSSGLTRGRRAAGKKGRQTPITPLRLGRCDSSRSGSRVEGAELSQALRCPAPPEGLSRSRENGGLLGRKRGPPRNRPELLHVVAPPRCSCQTDRQTAPLPDGGRPGPCGGSWSSLPSARGVQQLRPLPRLQQTAAPRSGQLGSAPSGRPAGPSMVMGRAAFTEAGPALGAPSFASPL